MKGLMFCVWQFDDAVRGDAICGGPFVTAPSVARACRTPEADNITRTFRTCTLTFLSNDFSQFFHLEIRSEITAVSLKNDELYDHFSWPHPTQSTTVREPATGYLLVYTFINQT